MVFLIIFFICASLLHTKLQVGAKGDRPNFILFLANDVGYGDLSTYGNPTIITPHLDKMAREGMKFTQIYSPASSETSSLAGILTGRYGIRSGFANSMFPIL